jgi:hypothetical protein
MLFAALAMWVGALWLAGCAEHHPTVTVVQDQVKIIVHPWRKRADSVKLVAKAPPADRYRYVGRVAGRAPTDDFVEAAKDAQNDLKANAAELGADVVKIDRLRPPSDSSKATRRAVLLTGRAYKAIEN